MRDFISEEEKETKGKVVSSGKNNIKINPNSEELKERTMGAREKAREESLKQKYDPSGMKASMVDKYGKEKGKQVYFATIRKKAMSKNDNLQDQFAGNYKGPLYAPHPDLVKEETPVEKIDRIAREKVAARSKEAADKKAARDSSAAAFQAHKKEVLAKGGRPVDALDSWQKKKMQDTKESAVPGKPAERLGAVTAIPKDEREAAKQRLLKKAAEKRAQLKDEYEMQLEARRMDREGVDRGDAGRAARAEKAKASLAAKQKRQAVLDKHEKKTGTKLDISRSKEGKEHATNFPGSRQQPKERGKKETPSETQNRRINASNARKIKHGFTSKEKREAESMAKHTSRFD